MCYSSLWLTWVRYALHSIFYLQWPRGSDLDGERLSLQSFFIPASWLPKYLEHFLNCFGLSLPSMTTDCPVPLSPSWLYIIRFLDLFPWLTQWWVLSCAVCISFYCWFLWIVVLCFRVNALQQRGVKMFVMCWSSIQSTISEQLCIFFLFFFFSLLLILLLLNSALLLFKCH